MVTLALKAILLTTFLAFLSLILFRVDTFLCKAVDFLSAVFEKFAGLDPVYYYENSYTATANTTTGGVIIEKSGVAVGKETTLIQMIFSNANINRIYWGMALIGIAMVFGFAIFAVMKKMFDVNDKMKQSMGGIIGNSLKAILLICSMNLIVSIALTGSQILLNQMDTLFDNARTKDTTVVITYDDEDYAAMLRCINTIGNYSINKSYNSRYNLNACYNAIREDLQFLQDRGKFAWPYRVDVTTKDPETNEDVVVKSGDDSWQSLLYDIAASNSGSDVNIDEYNESRNDAILYAMDVIRNKADLKPLESYDITYAAENKEDYQIGRMIMLLGTIDAAYNNNYNQTMSFTDDLRIRYLYGSRDIYDDTQVNDHFNIGFASFHYILVLVVAIMFIKQYLGMCFSAVARIFNMVFLYLVAPPFLAVMPLDDGGKAKQWTTAFIIQTFSLFGVVLSMRLFLLLIPLVINGNVIFFADNSRYQMMTQALFLLACAVVVKKAGGMITGILADNAGMQAINASDMMGEASAITDKALQKGYGLAKKIGSTAVGGLVQGAQLGDKKIDKENDKSERAAERAKAQQEEKNKKLPEQQNPQTNSQPNNQQQNPQTNSQPSQQQSPQVNSQPSQQQSPQTNSQPNNQQQNPQVNPSQTSKIPPIQAPNSQNNVNSQQGKPPIGPQYGAQNYRKQEQKPNVKSRFAPKANTPAPNTNSNAQGNQQGGAPNTNNNTQSNQESKLPEKNDSTQINQQNSPEAQNPTNTNQTLDGDTSNQASMGTPDKINPETNDKADTRAGTDSQSQKPNDTQGNQQGNLSNQGNHALPNQETAASQVQADNSKPEAIPSATNTQSQSQTNPTISKSIPAGMEIPNSNSETLPDNQRTKQ